MVIPTKANFPKAFLMETAFSKEQGITNTVGHSGTEISTAMGLFLTSTTIQGQWTTRISTFRRGIGLVLRGNSRMGARQASGQYISRKDKSFQGV